MTLLVGVKEAGAILGWDRRKVSTYHLRGAFPTPIQVLSSGPVWFREQINYFYQTKEKNIPVYYFDGRVIFRCYMSKEKEKTDLTLSHLENMDLYYILWSVEEIQPLIEGILNNQPLVRYVSPISIRVFYDFGLISEDVFLLFQDNYRSNTFFIST